jgi:light-regulated signal transduction histidine kinase (bacteriophytochrome)
VARVAADLAAAVADYAAFAVAPFVRSASPTVRDGGLGLGLTIVREIVELHGGQVRVESTGTGNGATFNAADPVTRRSAISPATSS